MNQYERFSNYPHTNGEYSISEKIVYSIINDFYNRKGFDYFWDDLDDDIISEIINDQVEKVSDLIDSEFGIIIQD